MILNIDVDADLAPAFNWNVKQLFAFVVAEYKTATNPVNQVRQPSSPAHLPILPKCTIPGTWLIG